MNKIILMGQLTRDPEIRYSQGSSPTAVARYTLAVERRKNVMTALLQIPSVLLHLTGLPYLRRDICIREISLRI